MIKRRHMETFFTFHSIRKRRRLVSVFVNLPLYQLSELSDGDWQLKRLSLFFQFPEMADRDRDREWDFYLRTLSTSTRESDPASDPSLLHSVKKLHELCKAEKNEDLVARVYPQINKLFQRSVASLSQSRAPNGLLLLAILQFYLDFGEVVLHDADPSLRTFFRSCLSREFADPTVAEATLNFLNLNKKKLLTSFLTLLPQFFPLLLKLIAWHGKKLEKSFLKVFPGLVSPGSFLPLFPSLVDLPILVVALEKVERSSGSLIGSGIASIQKSTAPEMLLALMDEAYTGSTIGDGGGDSESEDSSTIDAADPLFLELLKDENDGLAERHWTSPGMAAAIQAVINTPQSDRLKQILDMTPRLLDYYFAIGLRDVNNSLICALIPLLMSRNATMFPDKKFSYEVRKRLLEFMLATFQRSPDFIALLKKPITDRLGEAYDSSAKMELALQLCWAIGEYGGGGGSHKDAARELFESLELLLYENLSSSRLSLRQESTVGSDGENFRKSSQSRLLCFVVTAIAKLATYHRELMPRARVALGKVARSRISDARVWKRARDYLGLMSETAICLSVLGPSRPSDGDVQDPGIVNWDKGGTKMTAHVPFYILGEQEGPPFHDFSFSDILPRR
ncbi:AP-5 complex subunit zeta-1 [Tripterygium wilfordii]|uniref:AP-5 complex subunit zeta-1 n=1 Tax=Tripterygium wilfordii TaxID=458696 RepID=A0A7J7C383_TRIWF|nr:AP-5 complex subunit zeta-1 [Tripterygium wilfordii]KAF5728385.1 AP-5 complex subunit zeta-1 [Tripterygium wilfordii]